MSDEEAILNHQSQDSHFETSQDEQHWKSFHSHKKCKLLTSFDNPTASVWI